MRDKNRIERIERIEPTLADVRRKDMKQIMVKEDIDILYSIRDDIDATFIREWNKRKFRWFFPKRRKTKLKYRITRNHSSQIFEIMERTIDSALSENLKRNFDQFADVRDIAGNDGVFKPD
jgi:hypothetical protein